MKKLKIQNAKFECFSCLEDWMNNQYHPDLLVSSGVVDDLVYIFLAIPIAGVAHIIVYISFVG